LRFIKWLSTDSKPAKFMKNKKTLVLGATTNPSRYSYLAINKLRSEGHDVVAIGRRTGKVNDVEVVNEEKTIENLDTVTLYLNANNQKQYYNYILEQKPKRIIFNPGAENEELEQLARENQIDTQHACTLVLLSTHQY
jgi:predicted CoA-binding protein